MGFMDIKRMKTETYHLMTQSMGFTSSAVTPDSPIQTFSGGEKQGVAIVRALYFDADIIILDEPTMGLSLKETRKLLNFVRDIKSAGKSAVFIDHNIFHVYSVADRVVVIDRGRVAGEFRTSDITLDDLMDKMYQIAETGSFDGDTKQGDSQG
jgi:simple sugar transport system ATP-binding protein